MTTLEVLAGKRTELVKVRPDHPSGGGGGGAGYFVMQIASQLL